MADRGAGVTAPVGPWGGEEAFTWFDGERLIRYGRGTLAEAAELLASRGLDGFALLTTVRWRDSPVAAAADVVLEVPAGPVADASAAVRGGVGGRPVVALGGGRVIDSAKAVAGADGLSCAAIPTTLSGAELTGFHRLPAGAEGGRLVRPAVVVADPDVMASQPPPELAASAMNGLAHALEALYTRIRNPVATMAALRAAQLFASGLSREEPVAGEVSLAALLAGYASGMTGLAVHHVVCQTVVRLGGTPHAQTNALVLPHSVRMMVSRAPAEIGAFAAALGGRVDSPEMAPDLVARLVGRTGVKGLEGLGFDRDLIPAVIEAAASRGELQNMPGPPSEEDLRVLIEAAL